MHPYLTTQGKWIFACGVLLSLAGTLATEPALVLAGQVPFVVLTLGLFWLLPAARVLDRRICRFRVESQRESDEPGVLFLRREGEERLSIWFENHSQLALRIEVVRPKVEGRLETEIRRSEFALGAERERAFELLVRSKGIGRASLQGFDVVLRDRWGLLEMRDYLSCIQVFETYPSQMARTPLRLRKRQARQLQAEVNAEVLSPSGFDLRELREFQPGDPLRTIAWKATVRSRRLISKEFDEDRSRREFLALDVSSSMRAGTPDGEKFDYALELSSNLANHFLREGAEVGLYSFDHHVFGRIGAGKGREHLERIQRHLVGLRNVIHPGRTAMDEDAVLEFLADYLLIQERLDFRKNVDKAIDRELLQRWLRPVIDYEEHFWSTPSLTEGLRGEELSLARQFLRLRGVPLLPPAEVRAGSKIQGLRDVLREVLKTGSKGGRVVVISDLCAIKDLGMLERPFHIARRRGIEVIVLAPFTPAFGDGFVGLQEEASADEILRSLFAGAEREDREVVARRLQALGIKVFFLSPS